MTASTINQFAAKALDGTPFVLVSICQSNHSLKSIWVLSHLSGGVAWMPLNTASADRAPGYSRKGAEEMATQLNSQYKGMDFRPMHREDARKLG